MVRLGLGGAQEKDNLYPSALAPTEPLLTVVCMQTHGWKLIVEQTNGLNDYNIKWSFSCSGIAVRFWCFKFIKIKII